MEIARTMDRLQPTLSWFVGLISIIFPLRFLISIFVVGVYRPAVPQSDLRPSGRKSTESGRRLLFGLSSAAQRATAMSDAMRAQVKHLNKKFKKIKTSAESKGALSYNYLRLDLSFQDRRGEKFISVILEILVGGWLRLLCIGMVSEDLHIPFWNFQRIEHFS